MFRSWRVNDGQTKSTNKISKKVFFEKMWCEMVVRDGGVVISSVNI